MWFESGIFRIDTATNCHSTEPLYFKYTVKKKNIYVTPDFDIFFLQLLQYMA